MTQEEYNGLHWDEVPFDYEYEKSGQEVSNDD